MHHVSPISVPDVIDLNFIDLEFQSYRDNPDILLTECEINDLTNEHIRAAHSLSDEMFCRLASILKWEKKGRRVCNKSDLNELAQIEHAHLYEEEKIRYSVDDVEAFLLLTIPVHHAVDWRQISSLYNQASPLDRAALADYFRVGFDADLSGLLDIKAPQYDIPAELIHQDKTAQFGESLMVLDKKAGKWLKDTCFHHRLRVRAHVTSLYESNAFNDSHLVTSIQVVGATGHLDTAMAIANACLLQKLYLCKDAAKTTLNKIDIVFDNKVIAVADHQNGGLVWRKLPEPSEARELREKSQALSIEISEIRQNPFGRLIEPLLKQQSEIITKLEMLKGPYSQEEFKATCLKVEEAMGLQWGKVHDLETSLGL